MPLLVLLPLLGIGGTAVGVAVENWTEKKNVVTPAQAASVMPWYVTAGLVVIGGVLIYKYGAKMLKV